MKSILQTLGVAVFWVSWPIWYLYFKQNHRRSRVLVVAGGKVLLLKSWLGTNSWGLPGGGAHAREDIAASAVRELKEEAGIDTADTALRPLGKRLRHKHGLSYYAEYFALDLPDEPDIRLRKSEISDATWVGLDEVSGLDIDDDVTYALRHYRPLDQTELL